MFNDFFFMIVCGHIKPYLRQTLRLARAAVVGLASRWCPPRRQHATSAAAHAGHGSTSPRPPPPWHAAAPPPLVADTPCLAGDHWTQHDAGPRPLGWHRRQLSHRPALVLHHPPRSDAVGKRTTKVAVKL